MFVFFPQKIGLNTSCKLSPNVCFLKFLKKEKNIVSLMLFDFESTRRGLKAGGSLLPLLASGLTSPLLLEDRRHAENRRRWRGRRYHHHHRLQHRRRIRSSNYATRILLLSPHRRLSPDQHQRLLSHRRRRSQEKSLQSQRKIAQSCAATTPTKNLSRSTRSTTSRTLSAISSMEKTLPSSRPKDSRE